MCDSLRASSSNSNSDYDQLEHVKSIFKIHLLSTKRNSMDQNEKIEVRYSAGICD